MTTEQFIEKWIGYIPKENLFAIKTDLESLISTNNPISASEREKRIAFLFYDHAQYWLNKGHGRDSAFNQITNSHLMQLIPPATESITDKQFADELNKRWLNNGNIVSVYNNTTNLIQFSESLKSELLKTK